MSDNKENQYKSVKANIPSAKIVEQDSKNIKQPGWLKRKYIKIRKAFADFWVVGKYGFQLGGLAGLILGSVVGGIESIRMNSFWPLPLAMLGSGMTFGSIFAISTLLRSQQEAKLNNTPIEYEIVYYDDKSNKFIKAKVPMFNNKI